jgi:hypothetical protein
MQILLQGADNQTHSIAPQATTDGRWFANVPLSAYVNASPVLHVSFQNSALEQTRTVQWSQLNLFAAGDMVIRKGDSLLLNALPAGSTNGNFQISFGTNTYSGRTVQPIACRFAIAGVFTVTGTYAPLSGAPVSHSITVKVVEQSLTNRPACWVGMERKWDVPMLAPEAILQADARLLCEQTATLPNNGAEFSLLADANEPRSIVSRLGAGGPILDATRARGFNLWSGSDTCLKVVQRNADGSQIVEMVLICSPVFPDLTVRIDTIVGGITFDDGTTTKILTPADFDALGQSTVRFLRPASARTSVCHSIKVYQGSDLVGYLR